MFRPLSPLAPLVAGILHNVYHGGSSYKSMGGNDNCRFFCYVNKEQASQGFTERLLSSRLEDSPNKVLSGLINQVPTVSSFRLAVREVLQKLTGLLPPSVDAITTLCQLTPFEDKHLNSAAKFLNNTDMLIHIFHYLPVPSVVRCREVNRSFKEVATSGNIWQDVYMKR